MANIDIDTLRIRVEVDNQTQAGINSVNNSLSGIRSGSKSLIAIGSSLNNLSKHITGLSSGASGLKSAFSNIYDTISKYSDSVLEILEVSADYTETVNKMNVAFESNSQSIMDYANTVQSALGIYKTEWLDYQSTFGSLMKGMGVSQNNMKTMSQQLTQLAYDYSSLYNVDVSTAFKKLSSAMSGQIKGLKEYGNNVSVAMVNQTLMRHGINASVSDLDSASQAYARYITIMENASKTGVFNDMSRTLGTTSNQIRVFSGMVEQLKQSLGNLVNVIASAVLPVLNTFMAVIIQVANSLVSFLAGILHFDLSSFGKATGSASKNTSDLANNLSNAGTNAGKTASATKKATKSIKEYKKACQGFDELNLIPAPTESTSSSGSGSGGSGSSGSSGITDMSGYDWGSVIDGLSYDFLKGLTSSMDDRVDAMKQKLLELFKPITESWNKYGTAVFDLLKRAVDSVAKEFSAIRDAWYSVWQNGTGEKTLDTIFGIVMEIEKAVIFLASGFTNAWNSNKTGEKIIQNIWNAYNNILGAVELLWGWLDKIAQNIPWESILNAVEGITNAISNIDPEGWLKVAEALATFMILSKIVGSVITFAGALSSMGFQLLQAQAGLGLLGGYVTEATASLTAILQPLTCMFSGGILSGILSLVNLLGQALTSQTGILAIVVAMLVTAWHNLDYFRSVVGDTLTIIGNLLLQIWEGIIYPVLQTIIQTLGMIWDIGVKPLWNQISNVVGNIATIVLGLFNTVSPVISTIIVVLSGTLVPVIKAVGVVVGTVIGGILNIISKLIGLINVLLGGVAKMFSAFSKVGTQVVKGFTAGIKGIIDKVTEVFNKVIDTVKGVFGIHSPSKVMKEIGGYFIDGFIDGIGDLLTNIKNIFGGVISWISDKVGGFFKKKSSTVNVNTKLKKSGWSTLAKFIGSNKPVTANIKVKKYGWTKITTFLGIAKTLTATIGRKKNWTTSMEHWIGISKAFTISFSRKKSWSTSMKEWLGIDKALEIKFKMPKIKINWDKKTEKGFEITYPKSFSTYAQGLSAGLPTKGQMFVANEDGAELVGNLGGQSFVANQNDVMDIMSTALARGISQAMVQINNGSNSKDININIVSELDGDAIGRKVIKYHNDRVIQTGRSPLKI